MPTYEYKCDNCHELTEAFQRMSDEPLRTCPKCGKDTLHRLVTGGAGVIYKGEGWYVTDYSKKSSGGKETPPSSSSTTKPSGDRPGGGSQSSTDAGSSLAKTGS